MLNTIDLFAGCGGLTEGFKQSRAYSLLAAIEWEKAPLLSLRNRLEKKWRYSDIENKVIHFDIQRTDELFYGFSDDVYGESIGLDKLIGDSSVDIIIGGPPCQAYSIAGRIRDKNGMRDDYRNYLFESYLKVVDHFQPKACIFENVLGMLSATPGGISIIDRISKSFESIGYVISKNIKEQAVFDMSEFGIPQKRKRVILVAFNKNKIADSEILIDKFYFNLNKMKSGIKTVNDAIGDMPPLYPNLLLGNKVSHQFKEGNEIRMLDHIPRFHNQRDINATIYKDLYYPGLFWVPIVAHSGNVFLHGKYYDNEEFYRNRTFGRSLVACGEITVFIDPYFETRIYKTTDDKLTISIDIEGIEPIVYENSPAGTMFVITYGSYYKHGQKPFIAEYRPYSYKELAKKDI